MATALKELSFVEIMSAAQELADWILSSEEMKIYIEKKKALANDVTAQNKMTQFQKLKELYEEVERFGKYHPDYSRVSKEVRTMRKDLLALQSVSEFRSAENRMEEMLYQVSRTIADSVSETIKVPSDNPLYNIGASSCSSGGCGTGGSCGCG
ncbi:MAG TPA: YlbF family regulator [Bacillota bacterium]|nr:YlbF family regulator [Bacillota bacterium]